MSLSVHMIPILTWDGMTRDTAVWIFGSLGGSMIAGTLLFGLVGDRASPKVLTAILVSLPVISCVLLLYPSDSVAVKAVAINAFGLSAGAQMASYTNLSARYYGMRSFGTLSSISGMATMFATAVAPFIAGVIYDVTHGYTVLLVAGVPILLTASLCLFSLGPIPQFKPAAAQHLTRIRRSPPPPDQLADRRPLDDRRSGRDRRSRRLAIFVARNTLIRSVFAAS